MRTLRIYLRLLTLQARSQLAYRASFLFEVLSNALTAFLFFLTFALVLERFDNLAGWRLPEVAFLWGLVEIAFGLQEVLFSGFDDASFSQLVRLGQFDQLLLRPISLTAQVMASRLVIRRLSRIVEGLVIFGFATTSLNITWTPVKLLYLPVVIVSLIAFFGGLMIVGATITFWTIQPVEAMNIFTYGGTEMMSYPMSIYPAWMRRSFTYIIPAIFLNYYPSLYFLGKPDPFHLPGYAPFLAPVAGLSVLGASALIWRFGLRHYESTGT